MSPSFFRCESYEEYLEQSQISFLPGFTYDLFPSSPKPLPPEGYPEDVVFYAKAEYIK